MKKILSLLVAFGVMPAFAAPAYFTFTGTITFVPSDVGGYAAAHGISRGRAVTYVFLVDTTVNGFVKESGAKRIKPDSINEGRGYRADYFFDSLVTPSLFSAAVTDSNSGSFFGYHVTTTSGTTVNNTAALQMILGDQDHFTQVIVYIPNPASAVFLPAVGTAVSATELYNDSSAGTSSASMSMTLTAISDTRPVIGVRTPGPARPAWLSAGFQDGSLVMRNRSGGAASARILDAAGKTALRLSLGQDAAIPASALPRGPFFLRVSAPDRGEPVLRAFVH
jgi:hypothetical protein